MSMVFIATKFQDGRVENTSIEWTGKTSQEVYDSYLKNDGWVGEITYVGEDYIMREGHRHYPFHSEFVREVLTFRE